MNHLFLSTTLLLTFLIVSSGHAAQPELREIEGMFAAGMKAFYSIKRPINDESASNVLAAFEYRNDLWQESVVKQGVSEPSVSPDGMTLYKHQQRRKLSEYVT